MALVGVSPAADRFDESDAMLQLASKIAGVRSRPAADETEYADGVAAAEQSAADLARSLGLPVEVGSVQVELSLLDPSRALKARASSNG